MLTFGSGLELRFKKMGEQLELIGFVLGFASVIVGGISSIAGFYSVEELASIGVFASVCIITIGILWEIRGTN